MCKGTRGVPSHMCKARSAPDPRCPSQGPRLSSAPGEGEEKGRAEEDEEEEEEVLQAFRTSVSGECLRTLQGTGGARASFAP